MSPVNSDDSSGGAFGDAGRPLTRKELRAQELSARHEGQPAADHDAAEPQAPEAGTETPAAAPDLPAAAPTVHESATDPETAAASGPASELHQKDSAPGDFAPDDTAPEDTAPEDFAGENAVHYEPAYEYAGGGAGSVHPESDVPAGYELHHEDAHAFEDAENPAGYDTAGDHADDDGHELLAGAATVPASQGPSRKVRRRRFVALLLTLTVFVVAVVVGAQFLKPLLGGDTMADYPGPGTGEVIITVPPGSGPKSVATELQDKKVVANAETFLQEFLASGGALAPGDFTMRNEMKNSDAVAVLLNKDQGKVMYFALSAGLRINESLQAIADGTGAPASDLKALNESPAQFGVPAKAKNLEGFLAPGEYRFPLGTPAKDVVQKLVTTTLDELKSQGVTDPAKQYDVVTVASIVQAEGGQAEYGDVAGAIYNRLKPDNTETIGLIQSDATVTYGLGIKSFHIDETQKADKSNPYNTYANPGLPVGPIGSPGKTAIDAAANPKVNDYLYWVTINLDTKETLFSKTLAEHNTNVAKYNAWCEANAGRCV